MILLLRPTNDSRINAINVEVRINSIHLSFLNNWKYWDGLSMLEQQCLSILYSDPFFWKWNVIKYLKYTQILIDGIISIKYCRFCWFEKLYQGFWDFFLMVPVAHRWWFIGDSLLALNFKAWRLQGGVLGSYWPATSFHRLKSRKHTLAGTLSMY